ncbi:ATP-binding protein [Aurantimicrobium minutum]|uniref:ATP-binding protein n=1 Tax=Aurantimicrobium minutum TaxID=708131 RepID=UPI0024742504|nr:ATP-binding protein [Aurantimicrobium minutum]MDH6423199.1 putative ATPase [Aurantimicrobium minutum]
MSSADSPPWYVITGGPSSGKTTTVELLRGKGFEIAHEHASEIIAEEIVKGRTLQEVRADGEWFQKEILRRQQEHEDSLDPAQTVFLDRGIPDGLGYERFLKLTPNPELTAAAKATSYRRVFILDPLPVKLDWNRLEDEQTQHAIHDSIEAVYLELDNDVVEVPVLSPEERVEFILNRL